MNIKSKANITTQCVEIFIIGAIIFLIFVSLTYAARYWIASSAGNWSSTANWAASSGGEGGQTVPGAGQPVFFDGNGLGNCTTDANATTYSVNIGSLYTGTISQGTKWLYTYTTDGDFSQAGGTFSGGSVSVDCNGDFSLSGGAFSMPTLGVAVTGNFAITGGTFTHNSRTLQLDGSQDSCTFASGGQTIGVLKIMKDASTDEVILQDNIDFANGLWVNTGTCDFNGKSLNLKNIEVDEVTVENATGTVTFDITDGGWTDTSANAVNIGDVTIGDGSSSISTVLNGNVGCTDLTITTNATLNNSYLGTKYNISLTGNWSNSGTFTHNSSNTVTFAGSAAQTIDSNDKSFNNLSINNNGSTDTVTLLDALDVNGTLNINDGTFVYSNQDVNVKTLTIASGAAVTKGTGTTTFDVTGGTWTDNNSTLENIGNVAIGIENSAVTTTLGSAVKCDNLTIASGNTLDNDSTGKYDITVLGNWSNSGTFTHNSGGTVTFNGSAAQTITSNSKTFYNLSISNDGTAGNNTVTLQDSLDVNNYLYILDGTLVCTGGNKNINVGQTLFVQSSGGLVGAFTKGGGTLTFDGTEVAVMQDDTGTQDFGNVTIGDGTNSKTVTLAGNITVDDLTITANADLNTHTTQSYSITCSGNWLNSGTFTENQNTVTFDGASKTIGAETFYGLTISGTSISTTGNVICTNFNNSGTFTVGSGKTLTPAASGTYTNTGTITETGTIKLAATSIAITDSNGDAVSTVTSAADIYVTLTDYDENLNGSSKDTCTGVTISTAVDSETISLTETGIATGIFRNGSALPYTEYDGSATANDGTLEGQSSTTLTASYTDAEDSSDSSASDTATGQVFTTGFTVSATTPQVAGSNFTLTVTATTTGGSTSTTYSGTANLSVNYISPTTGTQTLSTTSTSSFSSGVASVSLNYPDCGTITITATDSSDTSITGTSGNIVFVPYDFTVVPNSTTQTVNKTFTLTITARNAAATTCANYKGTATISANTASCSTTGTFSPTTSLTSTYWSSGVATLTNAKFNKYGSIVFTVTDSTSTSHTGASSSIIFYPKDFSLSISDPPASRDFYYPSETFSLTVTARDNDSSAITNYNGTVNISASGVSGLNSSYAFTCSDSGSHTFTGVYGGSATTTANVTITDSARSSSRGTLSENITIKAGTLKAVTKSGPVGKNSMTVAIYDSAGSVITEDDSTTFTVTLVESNNDDSATSATTSTAQTLANGQATIYITDNQAEKVTVTPAVSSPSSADISTTSGILTIGTLTGAGINIEMWREVK